MMMEALPRSFPRCKQDEKVLPTYRCRMQSKISSTLLLLLRHRRAPRRRPPIPKPHALHQIVARRLLHPGPKRPVVAELRVEPRRRHLLLAARGRAATAHAAANPLRAVAGGRAHHRGLLLAAAVLLAAPVLLLTWRRALRPTRSWHPPAIAAVCAAALGSAGRGWAHWLLPLGTPLLAAPLLESSASRGPGAPCTPSAVVTTWSTAISRGWAHGLLALSTNPLLDTTLLDTTLLARWVSISAASSVVVTGGAVARVGVATLLQEPGAQLTARDAARRCWLLVQQAACNGVGSCGTNLPNSRLRDEASVCGGGGGAANNRWCTGLVLRRRAALRQHAHLPQPSCQWKLSPRAG